MALNGTCRCRTRARGAHAYVRREAPPRVRTGRTGDPGASKGRGKGNGPRALGRGDLHVERVHLEDEIKDKETATASPKERKRRRRRARFQADPFPTRRKKGLVKRSPSRDDGDAAARPHHRQSDERLRPQPRSTHLQQQTGHHHADHDRYETSANDRPCDRTRVNLQTNPSSSSKPLDPSHRHGRRGNATKLVHSNQSIQEIALLLHRYLEQCIENAACPFYFSIACCGPSDPLTNACPAACRCERAPTISWKV